MCHLHGSPPSSTLKPSNTSLFTSATSEVFLLVFKKSYRGYAKSKLYKVISAKMLNGLML